MKKRTLDSGMSAEVNGHAHEARPARGAHARQPHPYRLKLTSHKDALPSWKISGVLSFGELLRSAVETPPFA